MPLSQDSPSTPSALSRQTSATSFTSRSEESSLESSSRKAAPSDLQEERRRLHHEADVVIVGAGILGAALAVALGDQGRGVILLEKSLKEPERIVGELLQPGGVEALQKLGLRGCLEDIDAVRVKGYGVIFYGQMVEIPYPKNSVGIWTPEEEANAKARASEEKVKLKPEGRSFHHGRFVRNLRARATAHKNVTVCERTVTEVITNEDTGQVVGVEAETKEKEADFFFGSLTVICDGYASKFRKQFIRHTPKARSRFWGLELIDCPLPLPMHGHVVLGDNAPVLLYQIGTRETRVLVDVPEHTPSTSLANGGIKGHLRNVVMKGLPAQVQPSFQRALDEGSPQSMPNSFLPPAVNRTKGLIVLGDALNMRHPLTGGGMTVALNDVVLLQKLLGPDEVPDLDDTTLVLKKMQHFHWQRKNLTAVINILAQALYSLFAANDPQLKYLQRGCFRYFQIGGNCVDGPVGLLGGVIHQPLILFYHFFSVALLSIWILVSEGGVLRLPISMVQGALVFWKACVVIFPYIFAELRS